MLSLVVIASNEADRIGACLASVPFASERLVVESRSADDTVSCAEAAGARVVSTDWPGHVAQKNRGLELASHDWVLSLDADEALSPEAAAEVERALHDPAGAVGFSFPRCSTWLGTPLRHGRWYPDRKLRLVRRSLARWQGDDPHDRLVVDGLVRELQGDILHDPYRDLREHLRTIDRYTRIHAKSLDERGQRAQPWDVALRPPLHFIDAYLRRRGFMDGRAGLAVAALGAVHTGLKWSRLYKRNRS